MPNRPVFDNNCFGANSTLFIPAFKSLRKPTSSNSEAMSRGLGSKGPDEREAREKLRTRMEELRKLANDDDVIKHDKYHATNLILSPSPATLADRDRDIVVTAAAHAQPPPPLSADTNPQTQHEHITSHTPTPTPSESNQSQWDNQTNRREQREGPTGVGVEGNETRKHEQVAGEVEAARGRHPPPPTALVEHDEEHDNETSA